MNRFADKMGSIRAVSLLAMVVTLCAAVFLLRQEPAWPRLFEAALMFLLGNYSGRTQTPQNPTQANGVKVA